ncbi:MAG TPA: HTTM domain-containing protein [Polyangiaceae bacterium]
MTFGARIARWLETPVPLARLALVRIVLPLVVLGFMSARLAHASHWIGDAGFRVPDLGDHWAQPLYVPALPAWAAWTVAVAMIASGLLTSVGLKTRASALVFAATLVFCALSDRLAAFSVSKLSPTLILAVAAGPAERVLSVDAWLHKRRTGKKWKSERPCGSIRFLQLVPLTIYMASGIAKARADWLHEPLVLYSQIHGSYQTWIAYSLARAIPSWLWTTLQGTVLVFESTAPITFAIRKTRPYALVFGLGMHAMIALMFGPVVWFSLLMMTVLAAGWMPDRFFALMTPAARDRRGDLSDTTPRRGPARRSRRATSP